MNSYEISKEYAVYTKHSSKGTQIKFYKDGKWYKVDNLGNEGIAEAVSCDILSCSNVEPSEYVKYEMCLINGKMGCVSDDFLRKGESFLSFQKIYDMYEGGNLSDKVLIMRTPEERFSYIINFIKQACSIDCAKYLSNTLALDMFTMNPDRHFHNLGVIMKEDNSFRCAPIFDNGQGFFQNRMIFPPYMSMEEKIEKAVAATISGSFYSAYMATDRCFKINFGELEKKLEEYPKSQIKQTILNQISIYRRVLGMENE